MDICCLKINDIQPYENNPRINDGAVDYVADSIKEFGFKNPIIIDKNNVIVCGHTRYKAAKRLGIELIPCIKADDLTDEQVKAFRLVDNKTAELAEWDYWQSLKEITCLQIVSLLMKWTAMDMYTNMYTNMYKAMPTV